MKQVSVAITDMDNTLYDWVEIWYRSFSAMLEHLVKESGIDQDTLEKEIRAVFQQHGTSEYAFVIEELTSLPPRRRIDLIFEYYRRIFCF